MPTSSNYHIEDYFLGFEQGLAAGTYPNGLPKIVVNPCDD